MFIKLARFEDTDNSAMIPCCQKNGVAFIELTNEYFGLCTTDFSMSYGRDDFLGKPETGLKAFIDIYQCAAENGIAYVGLLLTNDFFRNIFIFCREFEIEVTEIKITSKYGTADVVDDPEDIQDIINNEEDDFSIQRVQLDIKGISVIINNIGYVDIADRGRFFGENQSLITNMLLIGINE